MVDSILNRTPPAADARIIYGDAQEHFADLRVPAGNGPFPAIAFIHGGFWRAKYDLTHAGTLCAALTRAGFVTWNLEYRRLGNEGGGWPGTFHDVAGGLRYLFDHATEHNIDPVRVVVLGHSAGGHLAIWAAGAGQIARESEIRANPLPLRGAVSMAGVLDLRESFRLGLGDNVVADLLGGSPDEVPDRYAAASPVELVPTGVRQVIVHGLDDDIVPSSISAGYVAAATAAGDDVALLELANTEHFAVIDPESPVFPRILKAITTLFDDPAPVPGRGAGGLSRGIGSLPNSRPI